MTVGVVPLEDVAGLARREAAVPRIICNRFRRTRQFGPIQPPSQAARMSQ